VRVAVLSHTHPSVTSGGAEISAYTAYRGMLALGVDAIFVSACRETDLNRVELGSEREFVVGYDETAYDYFYHLSPARVEGEVLEVLRRTERTVASFHHFMFLGAQTVQAAQAEGISSFLTLHEFLALCQNDGQMVTRPQRRLCTRAAPARCVACWPEYDTAQFATRRSHLGEMLDGVTGLISPSAFLKERFVQAGVNPNRIRVIENGLANNVRPQPRRRDDGEPWTFGYFGQINQYKGVDVLLAAAELLAQRPADERPLFRIHGPLVGQTEAFAARLEAAVRAGLVEYVGPYLNTDVPELMGACDYVVAPSLWWENSPVVIQEAFATGRPLIVSGIGGMAEKVQDGRTGLHFRVGSPHDLARTVTRASDEALWSHLCAHLPATLTATTMAKRYLAYFASAEAAVAA
jgi:glycosyltransferase involved in cell wall biosynthesis